MPEQRIQKTVFSKDFKCKDMYTFLFHYVLVVSRSRHLGCLCHEWFVSCYEISDAEVRVEKSPNIPMSDFVCFLVIDLRFADRVTFVFAPACAPTSSQVNYVTILPSRSNQL